MSKALSILTFLWNRRSLWATVFFVTVVGFLDENSVVNLIRQQRENAVLRAEIERYEEEYRAANTRLKQLSSSQKAVEEVARVNLLMKSDDEDVYIVE